MDLMYFEASELLETKIFPKPSEYEISGETLIKSPMILKPKETTQL